MNGFLLIDKPEGITSHDVVYKVRKATGEKRVGHAGTLDPFATGLLLVGVTREATKQMQNLVGLDKVYEATFVFGAHSDTDDKTGDITEAPMTEDVTPERIQAALPAFIGDLAQTPPDYSAIKIGGKKMYEAARKGTPLKAEPRNITVHSFELLGGEENTYRFRIHCGSGTYIRALARDLGAALGTAAYVEALRRTCIGPFDVKDAASLELVKNQGAEGFLVPTETILGKL